MNISGGRDASVAERIARMFLEIGVVKLNTEEPFVWSSGWKSPIYCDGRISLSYPQVRSYIKEELAELIRKRFPEVEAIAGVATAGIPQGVLVADALDLPFLYVRTKPKGHGMTNIVEGEVVKEQKVIVIEDLVSTGGSSLKATAALDLSGMDVLGLISVFTYGFDDAREHFANANIPFISLSNYDVLIKEAMEQDLISATDLSSLQEWRKAPHLWKQDA
ncbi:orotate phosphoribosyltransferase [Catalinimonas niigatensis]|uniref:orotate phosphoribosyltransferase n=1 Tax=Catalinimonas niigatensis TaxID=1397264 RepID=UPI002665EE35|nr:orotate phosphoribosyltransferase [Catalinimonas niigatensis]WPP53620.1 orotate phosphoribosyltransferase [Catalinimonas niigatensis]